MLSVPCVIISALLLSGSLKYILNYSDVKKKKKKIFFCFIIYRNIILSQTLLFLVLLLSLN